MSNKAVYTVLDTETGGVTTNHALLSIAFVQLDQDLEEVFRYYEYVIDTDDAIIEEEALEVNKIDLKLVLQEGIPISSLVDLFPNIVQDTIIVGHNAAFDLKMINARCGFNLKSAVDTMLLAYWLWPKTSNKLANVAQRLQIEADGYHDALQDVIVTCEVLRKMREMSFPFDPLKPVELDFNLDIRELYKTGAGLPWKR